MIVDAYSGKLVTARPFPKIVLIQFDVGEKVVTLSGPDVESLTVEIPDKNQTGKLETQVKNIIALHLLTYKIKASFIKVYLSFKRVSTINLVNHKKCF